MTAPEIPARRPAATVRPPQPAPRVPYRDLFVEAEYVDGRPYAEAIEDDEATDTTA